MVFSFCFTKEKRGHYYRFQESTHSCKYSYQPHTWIYPYIYLQTKPGSLGLVKPTSLRLSNLSRPGNTPWPDQNKFDCGIWVDDANHHQPCSVPTWCLTSSTCRADFPRDPGKASLGELRSPFLAEFTTILGEVEFPVFSWGWQQWSFLYLLIQRQELESENKKLKNELNELRKALSEKSAPEVTAPGAPAYRVLMEQLTSVSEELDVRKEEVLILRSQLVSQKEAIQPKVSTSTCLKWGLGAGPISSYPFPPIYTEANT
jgi:hypothetical protein